MFLLLIAVKKLKSQFSRPPAALLAEVGNEQTTSAYERLYSREKQARVQK